ncbi:ABC transporter substrate-binding protein [soil metagenome]
MQRTSIWEEKITMRFLRTLALAATTLALSAPAYAQATSSTLPRNETLIVENPEGTVRNAGWFNIWAVNGGSNSNGLHQLTMDTFWFIDPEYGLDNKVWDNSLASEPPIHNADFTQMTVKLRSGIFWSDGVEFNADDVLFTTETHLKTNGLIRSAQFQANVASVEAPDKNTVIFKLKAPNSRFHALFTVRWNAAWIMPKHIFEGKDPLKYDFNPPISIGPYKLHSFDPNGQWFTWEKRADWQKTSLARWGEPGPKYVTYMDPGPPDKRVIAQLNHQLDIIHDVSPEGMFTLAKDSKTSHGWFKGFPYGHPDPTLIALIFNHQNPKFQNKDVRWALALALDIKAISMASYRGAATLSAIGVPPTGTHPDFYHRPMEEWLSAFELDTGKQKIKPYDPTVGKQIADMLRPSMGDQIPSDPKAIAGSFGSGWWKQNLQAATELLERAGFKKQGNDWYMPNGERFAITVVTEGDARPVTTRAGSMIAQQWRQFGIDAKAEAAQATFGTRRNGGDYETIVSWSVETWGGHPDLSYFFDSWHSQYVKPAGEVQTPRNWQRWKNPELDTIIEKVRKIGFDDKQGIELGKEYVKLAVREMPTIPIMSYNVFTVMDETYWTGYPTADNPYTNPVPNWSNSRYMMVKLKPAKK